MKNLRLSPSGPVVGGIGPNFARRADMAVDTVDEITLDGTDQDVGADLHAELAGILADSKIKIEVEFDVENLSSQTTATIVTTLEASVDGGLTFGGIADFEHTLGCTGVGGDPNAMVRPIYVTHEPFAVSGIVDFTGALEVRATVHESGGEVDKVTVSPATAWIRLTELSSG